MMQIYRITSNLNTLLYNLQVFASHSHTMHCYKSDSEAMAKAEMQLRNLLNIP